MQCKEEQKDFDSTIFTEQFSKLLNQLSDQARISVVSKMDLPDKETFLKSIGPMKYPVVFRDNLKPADEILKILSRNYADIELEARQGNYADPDQYLTNRQRTKVKLGNYLSELERQSRDQTVINVYAGNVRPSLELLLDIGCIPPSFYKKDSFETPAMWLGGAGAVTPLHKDGSDNFAIHFWGRKRWTLFPVRDIPLLYMKRVIPSSDFAVSNIDLRKPDYKKFQDMVDAVSINIEVSAGEILYLPQGWAHFVENLEPTLMINYWIKEINKR